MTTNKKLMLAKLASMSHFLDDAGLYADADIIDATIKRIASKPGNLEMLKEAGFWRNIMKRISGRARRILEKSYRNMYSRALESQKQMEVGLQSMLEKAKELRKPLKLYDIGGWQRGVASVLTGVNIPNFVAYHDFQQAFNTYQKEMSQQLTGGEIGDIGGEGIQPVPEFGEEPAAPASEGESAGPQELPGAEFLRRREREEGDVPVQQPYLRQLWEESERPVSSLPVQEEHKPPFAGGDEPEEAGELPKLPDELPGPGEAPEVAKELPEKEPEAAPEPQAELKTTPGEPAAEPEAAEVAWEEEPEVPEAPEEASMTEEEKDAAEPEVPEEATDEEGEEVREEQWTERVFSGVKKSSRKIPVEVSSDGTKMRMPFKDYKRFVMGINADSLPEAARKAAGKNRPFRETADGIVPNWGTAPDQLIMFMGPVYWDSKVVDNYIVMSRTDKPLDWEQAPERQRALFSRHLEELEKAKREAAKRKARIMRIAADYEEAEGEDDGDQENPIDALSEAARELLGQSSVRMTDIVRIARS